MLVNFQNSDVKMSCIKKMLILCNMYHAKEMSYCR